MTPLQRFAELREAIRLGRELLSFGAELAAFTMNLGRLLHQGGTTDDVVELVRARETKAGEAANLAAKNAGPRRR